MFYFGSTEVAKATRMSKGQGFLKIGDGFVETFVQFNLWGPLGKRVDQGYIGSALGGIVFGEGFLNEA